MSDQPCYDTLYKLNCLPTPNNRKQHNQTSIIYQPNPRLELYKTFNQGKCKWRSFTFSLLQLRRTPCFNTTVLIGFKELHPCSHSLLAYWMYAATYDLRKWLSVILMWLDLVGHTNRSQQHKEQHFRKSYVVPNDYTWVGQGIIHLGPWTWGVGQGF